MISLVEAFTVWVLKTEVFMREAIKKAFFDYTVSHEGYTPFMYADSLNLVTTGVGNLIDASARNSRDTSPSAMAPAMKLPWKLKGDGWTSKNPTVGRLATPEEVIEEWSNVKLDPMQGKNGGFAYANKTKLTLSMEDIQSLFDETREKMENALRSKYFPNYDEWPADAQVAIMSMSWAMGPENLGNQFVNLRNALNQNPPNFAAAAKSAEIKNFGSLSSPNTFNGRNYTMFMNAADVQANGGDRDTLFFQSGSIPKGGPNPTPSIQDKLNDKLNSSSPGGSIQAPNEPSSVVKSAAIVGLAVGVGYGLYKYAWPALKEKVTP